jgi:hypothetical protein
MTIYLVPTAQFSTTELTGRLVFSGCMSPPSFLLVLRNLLFLSAVKLTYREQ